MALDCTCIGGGFPVRPPTPPPPPLLAFGPHTLGPETSFCLRDKNDQMSANTAGKVQALSRPSPVHPGAGGDAPTLVRAQRFDP